MPKFTFVARDAEGRTQRAVQEAPSEAALVEQLRAGGLVTLEVKRAQGEPIAGAPGLASRLLSIVSPPRSIDVEVALQQIAFMLRSGLPLVLALKTCSAQSARRSMGHVWTAVSERVQGGGSFSDALAAHRCFPHIVVTMVSVGEHTGELDEVLMRAARTLERRRNNLTGVATALTYPMIVLVMAVAVVIYMMVGLIPKLSKFLASFGRRLPPMTQLLIDISTFVQTHLVEGVVLAAVGAGTLVALYAWPPGRLAIDRGLLALPVVGGVLRLAATATFARNLGSLVTSGVRLTDALRVVEPLVRNQYLARCVAAARERVMQGASLAEPLSRPGAFLPMLPNMVAVGESSGTLDEVLGQVADFHEMRLEAVIRRLAAVIEPAILVVVGGVVGFIYMSFFMALYAIVGAR